MGIIDFNQQPYFKTDIEKTLANRGMTIDPRWEWEVHGPHPDFKYQVYVGFANARWQRGTLCVAIYPNKVYEIDSPCAWNKINSEKEINNR